MMHSDTPAYGLWSLVVLNSAVFIVFAFSLFHPRTSREWRSLGGFAAFIVALFTEMYGFPLTIYLLSGWLGNRFPGLDLLSHDSGHLLNDFIGWKGDPHLSPPHLLSSLLIFGGFALLASAWSVLCDAATTMRGHRGAALRRRPPEERKRWMNARITGAAAAALALTLGLPVLARPLKVRAGDMETQTILMCPD